MPNERNFPDVEFVETDTEALVDEVQALYEEEYGRKLHPADPVNQLIMWFCSILSQERSMMNIAAKRNLPRYAEGEYLDSLAEIFYGVERQEAAPAGCTMRFTLSEELERDVTITAGTEVTPDGEIVFATTEALTIPAGESYGDVTAECTTAGTAGNGFAAGSINGLIDQVAYVAAVENISASSGGTEIESDDAFYYRMREIYEGMSTAGTAGAYKYQAMKYNAAVADVVVVEDDPGETGVVLLMDTGIPTASEIADMQSYLSGDDIRPVTDKVNVRAPEAVSFGIEITYYGAERPEPGGEELRTLVTEAVAEYTEWQTSKIGRRINPGKLIALVIQAGAGRVEVTSPTARALTTEQCAVLSGDPVLTYGGEDE